MLKSRYTPQILYKLLASATHLNWSSASMQLAFHSYSALGALLGTAVPAALRNPWNGPSLRKHSVRKRCSSLLASVSNMAGWQMAYRWMFLMGKSSINGLNSSTHRLAFLLRISLCSIPRNRAMILSGLMFCHMLRLHYHTKQSSSQQTGGNKPIFVTVATSLLAVAMLFQHFVDHPYNGWLRADYQIYQFLCSCRRRCEGNIRHKTGWFDSVGFLF